MNELTLAKTIEKHSPVCVNEGFLNEHLLCEYEPATFKLEWKNHPDTHDTEILECMFGYTAASQKPDVIDSFFVTGIDTKNRKCYILRISKSKVIVMQPACNIPSEDFRIHVMVHGNWILFSIDQFFTRKPITEYEFVSNIEDVLKIGKAYLLVRDDGEEHDVIFTGIDHSASIGDSLMLQFYDKTEGMQTGYVTAEDLATGKCKIYNIRTERI